MFFLIISLPTQSSLSTGLPYESLISFATASRAMLKYVLPLVSMLHIEEPSQLQLGLVTKHLRKVHSVSIYKLFRKRYSLDCSLELDQRAANKVVHFLCRFPLLKTVFFGGEIGSDSTLGDRNVCSLVALGNTDIRTDHEGGMNHLIDSISGAFDCGALSNSVSIIGLSCPRRLNPTRDTGVCNVCESVCKYFPLSNIGDVDLCHDASCRELIESRQGGEDYLRSKTRFLQLLGKGRIGSICVYETVVGYDAALRDALQGFVEVSELDVTKLSQEVIFNAITKQHPNKNATYVNEQSFDFLKTTLGLSVSDSLLDPEACRLENLPRMLNNVMREEENSSLIINSLNWISTFLHDKLDDHSFQEVIGSGLLPKLIDFLQRDYDYDLQLETVGILVRIAGRGSKHIEALVTLGVVPHFIRLMGSWRGEIAKVAALALGNIAKHHRDLVLQAGAVQPLIKLLDQTSDLESLWTYTWVLVIFCRGEPNADFNISSLQSLNKLIHHSDDDVVKNACWVLKYLTNSRSINQVQIVLDVLNDAGLIRILELSSKPLLPALMTVGNIAAAGNDSQTQLLIDNDALPCLRGLLSYTNDDIVDWACWTISNITAGTREQKQAVTDSGILSEVIPMLNHERTNIRVHAVRTISNILWYGSLEQYKFVVVKERHIPPLLDLLAIDTEAKVLTGVLQVMIHVR